MNWNLLRPGLAVLFRCCHYGCRKLLIRATLGCSRLPPRELAAVGYFNVYPGTVHKFFDLFGECVCPHCGECYGTVVAIKTVTGPLLVGLPSPLK